MLNFWTTGMKFLTKAVVLFSALFLLFFSLSHADTHRHARQSGHASQSRHASESGHPAPYIKLAQEESSIFSEEELGDIEGGENTQTDDDLLEREFNEWEEVPSEDNFDPNEFEQVPTGSANEEGSEESSGNSIGEREGSDIRDYDIPSDRPDYEIVITDEELKKRFENPEGDG